MPKLITRDATLHAELDGEGEPVTVLAHGLTNSCRELARLTPLFAGTKVRFCFRGHGHSSAPESGYRFADFARDLDAVATAYGATAAVGTSLGAGALCNLLARRPDRFERMIFLLPAGLDRPFRHRTRFLRTARLLKNLPLQEAVDEILSDPDRLAAYTRAPWLRELDRESWSQTLSPVGLARAIEEALDDVPVADRNALRAVEAPVLIICREGDPIHPARLGRILAEVLPNSELVVYRDEVEMFRAMPELLERVRGFLAGSPV